MITKIRWPRPASTQVPRDYVRRGAFPRLGELPLEKLMADIMGTEPERIVAGWLEFNEIAYDFQYPLMGGRMVAGGIVADFVLWIVPGPIVLYVNSWWHTWPERVELDAVQRSIIEENVGWRCEYIWEHEIRDYDLLDARMRELITGWRPMIGGFAIGQKVPPCPPCCDDERLWGWYRGTCV